jgi:hypothetical protein
LKILFREEMEHEPIIGNEADPRAVSKEWFPEIEYPSGKVCKVHLDVEELTDKGTISKACDSVPGNILPKSANCRGLSHLPDLLKTIRSSSGSRDLILSSSFGWRGRVVRVGGNYAGAEV